MENQDQQYKYLAIKNWKKYQAGTDRKGRQIKAWVKDYAGKDIDDPEYSKLTMSQRYLWDGCIRLRARTGRNLSADPAWIALALGVIPKERPVLPRNILALVERGFLVLTNRQFDESESETQPETQSETETETQQASAPTARIGAVSPLPSGGKDKTSGPVGSLANQDQKQNQPLPQEQPQEPHRKPCGCSDGLCDWSEPIPDCSNPASVGDAVYYQRHVKKNDYFKSRLSRGYVVKEWMRLLNDTPEDWCYDPDPLFEDRERHENGMDEPAVTRTYLRRAPRTPKERKQVLAKFPHLPEDVRKLLYDPACKNQCKAGVIDVSDYPDDPLYSRLKHAELCPCVTREE